MSGKTVSENPIERYLTDIAEVRGTRSNAPETSFYPALENLLTGLGKSLSPRVRCVINLANRGAGLPDGGLFTADQYSRHTRDDDRNNPFLAQNPSCGVIEAKSPEEDVRHIAETEQVERYWKHYGMVLVTNFRAFALVGRDVNGQPRILESYALAASVDEFWRLAIHAQVSTARSAAERVARGTARRGHDSCLLRPRCPHADGALWARRRSVTSQAKLHFADALRETSATYRVDGPFDWRLTHYLLRVPMLRALFLQAANPDQLGRLGLIEILPAPQVIAHLQIGLELETLGAPLSDRIAEVDAAAPHASKRPHSASSSPEPVGVYLTNALNGWEPPKERILVIPGSPPYNGYAGVAVAEQPDLSNAYRTTNARPLRKARDSTTFTFASSAWLNAESLR